jgi:hypothetical protein
VIDLRIAVDELVDGAVGCGLLGRRFAGLAEPLAERLFRRLHVCGSALGGEGIEHGPQATSKGSWLPPLEKIRTVLQGRTAWRSPSS